MAEWLGQPALALACVAAFAAAGTASRQTPKAGKKTWPYAAAMTYEQRVAASPRNLPLHVDSLVLPHPHARNVLPNPFFAKAGRRAFRYPDLDPIVWQIIPKADKHDEYLGKRKELLAKGHAKELCDWCDRNGLPLLAEFEIRHRLLKFRHFRERGYQPVQRRWLRHADKRQVEYDFALPVNGEWFVTVDTTGHHRLKHGAAYAWDLIIKRNGGAYRGDPFRNENHYAWAQPVIAQADGIVRSVTDHHPDAQAGRSGGWDNANFIAVDYGGGILAGYGHLKHGSAQVKPGQRVAGGQTLALCGNSGASGAPHLHFTMLDAGYFSIKGRYRFEVKLRRGWKLIEGRDLRGGFYARNPADAFKRQPATSHRGQ